MPRWLLAFPPAVDLGLRGPKAAWALPALPRGLLPALAQGQLSQTTAAARTDPFRNSPLEFIHPTTQSRQLAAV